MDPRASRSRTLPLAILAAVAGSAAHLRAAGVAKPFMVEVREGGDRWTACTDSMLSAVVVVRHLSAEEIGRAEKVIPHLQERIATLNRHAKMTWPKDDPNARQWEAEKKRAKAELAEAERDLKAKQALVSQETDAEVTTIRLADLLDGAALAWDATPEPDAEATEEPAPEQPAGEAAPAGGGDGAGVSA